MRESQHHIGINGPIGSGKTTISKLLRYHILDSEIVTLATPIKKMLEAMGVPEKHIYGTQEERLEPLDILCGKSARWALQTLGTEWGRETIDERIWLENWRYRAKATGRFVVICDDVRFQDEVDMISENGFVFQLYGRDGEQKTGITEHRSEHGQLENVVKIHNGGMMTETVRQIVRYFNTRVPRPLPLEHPRLLLDPFERDRQ